LELQDLENLSGIFKLKTNFGAVAQLGERHNGIVEVTGSNPVGSTPFNLTLENFPAKNYLFKK